MASEFFSGLSQNFSQLLDDADDYNTIINIGEDPNTKEFHVHSNVLRARSPYFKRALSPNWITKKNDMIYFTKSNISPTVFEMIIRYMYTGVLDLREQVGSDILDLLVTSDELLIEELVDFVQKYLIEKQTEWLQQNFVNVLHTVFPLINCKKLYDFCLDSICDNPEPFFESANFLTLERDILLKLLKRKDLIINEIELWDHLIEWGITQTSELTGNDLKTWEKKDFCALKNTLSPIISYIRFFEITSKAFYTKICPFKELLPKTLFRNIVTFHKANIQPKNKLPPRYGKVDIDSMIVKPKHAAIFANWIQRKDANAKIPKDKYNFDLIYRGSRDGFDTNTMRISCDGNGACIIVIKIEKTGAIIGGYNPLGWDICEYCDEYSEYRFYDYYDYHDYDCHECDNRDYWESSTESFVFSLGDGKNLNNIKISRVSDSNYAIYEPNCDEDSLNFGDSDLVINGRMGSCNKRYYERRILNTKNFFIEEMEIFTFAKND